MEETEGVEPSARQGHYTSCMKMNGVPLLPPLMTREYRQEMLYYKQLAVAVERRISDLKVCLDDTITVYSTNVPSDWEDGDTANTSMDMNLEKSLTSDKNVTLHDGIINNNLPFDSNDFTSLNSQITIINTAEDSIEKAAMHLENSNLESRLVAAKNKILCDGNTTVPPVKNLNKEQTKKEMAANKKSPYNRPLQVTNKNVETKSKPIASRQSSDLKSSKENLRNSSPKRISNSPLRNKKNTPAKKESPYTVRDVTPKRFSAKKRDLTCELPRTRKSILSVEKSKLSPSKNVTGSLNNISSGLTSPPKLVRQNSYTLEYPSPFLIAHLEVQSLNSGVDVGSISMSESTSTSQLWSATKSKPFDIHSAKETWSSFSSDVNSIMTDGKSESFTPKNKLKNNVISNTNQDNKMNVSKVTPRKSGKRNSSETSSTLSSSKTESSYYIMNAGLAKSTSEIIQNEFENKCIDFGSAGNAEQNGVPNIYLDYVMKKFHDDHEKQMMALVKKQQEEQMLMKKAFEKQQKLLMTQFQAAFNQSQGNAAAKLVSASNSIEKQQEVSSFNHSSHISNNKSLPAAEKMNENFKNLENNSEKYLTISADVVNKPRCLMINKKTVNLSPTNIQCVNVPPAISNISTMSVSDTDNSSDERVETRSNKSRSSRRLFNQNTDYCLPKVPANSEATSLSGHSHDLSRNDSNSTFYLYDDPIEDALQTCRTNYTLDELNFTFESDDAAHTIRQVTPRSVHSIQQNDLPERELEKAEKLRNALSKISEIQKNLASKSLTHRSIKDPDVFYNGRHSSEHDQSVSLSNIDVTPSYYTNLHSQRSNDRNALYLNLTEVHKPSGERAHPVRQYKSPQQLQKEIRAATIIVSHAKGYLTRRLMQTERAQSTVQTIRDTLLCALQLHREQAEIRGPDVDLHRRLIQQITAACYNLHDMFIVYSPAERMSIIRQDRERRLRLSFRSPSHTPQLSATTQRVINRKLERMSRSHTGVFGSSRSSRSSYSSSMTRSHYEPSESTRILHSEKDRRSVSATAAGEFHSRKPWR